MKKFLLTVFIIGLLVQPCHAWSWGAFNCDETLIKRTLKTQIKYANRTDFKRFIKTYDTKYVNSDGFNLDIYSKLVQDIWKNYNNIKYSIEIKNITVSGNKAKVELIETSFADIPLLEKYKGELNSRADSIYYLEKIDGDWKIVSDEVLDEMTSILYGDAKDLEIKLTVPNKIDANEEYCATLEFTPPQDTMAIASIASDLVQYPQKPTEEVFRALPEDNVLERLFTANNQNTNEYIIASIGLTKTSVCNMNLQLSLTGFGYAMRRVNVIPTGNGESNDKNK